MQSRNRTEPAMDSRIAEIDPSNPPPNEQHRGLPMYWDST